MKTRLSSTALDDAQGEYCTDRVVGTRRLFDRGLLPLFILLIVSSLTLATLANYQRSDPEAQLKYLSGTIIKGCRDFLSTNDVPPAQLSELTLRLTKKEPAMEIVPKDPWGREFLGALHGDRCRLEVKLTSLGPDGILDSKDDFHFRELIVRSIRNCYTLRNQITEAPPGEHDAQGQ